MGACHRGRPPDVIMTVDRNITKYFGFWPAPPNYFEPAELSTNSEGYISDSTKSQLLEKIVEIERPGWKIAVTGDYLCMLHLDEIESALRAEREHNQSADIANLRLGVSRSARFEYVEALSALNFLLFCARFTGRGDYTIHDYFELTTWLISRFHYGSDGLAIKGGAFSRPPQQQLRRIRALKVEAPQDRFPIDLNVFRDAISYWEVLYDADLLSTASVGSKLISEHRKEDFRACVGLTWFEIEKWLTPFAEHAGLNVYQYRQGNVRRDRRTGQPMYKMISTVIDDFPEGTWIYANADDLRNVAWLLNQVAHKGYMPSRPESANAINVFMRVLNFRSGLCLRADTNPTPTSGVS